VPAIVLDFLAQRFKLRMHREFKQVAGIFWWLGKTVQADENRNRPRIGSWVHRDRRSMPRAPTIGYSMEVLTGLLANAINADHPSG
jgi:hypothetical protein